MTISYPLTLPGYPDNLDSVQITPAPKVAMTAGEFSFRQNVYERSGQIWRLDLMTIPLDKAAARAWIAFVLKLRGQVGTFLAGDPVARIPRGTVAGSPVVNGAGQTGPTLDTRGWTPGATGVLRESDWFQLGSGAAARLYQNLTDVDADGSGNATLDVWPDVKDQPADGEGIITTDPVGQFRLARAENPYKWRLGDLTQISLVALEVEE